MPPEWCLAAAGGNRTRDRQKTETQLLRRPWCRLVPDLSGLHEQLAKLEREEAAAAAAEAAAADGAEVGDSSSPAASGEAAAPLSPRAAAERRAAAAEERKRVELEMKVCVVGVCGCVAPGLPILLHPSWFP